MKRNFETRIADIKSHSWIPQQQSWNIFDVRSKDEHYVVAHGSDRIIDQRDVNNFWVKYQNEADSECWQIVLKFPFRIFCTSRISFLHNVRFLTTVKEWRSVRPMAVPVILAGLWLYANICPANQFFRSAFLGMTVLHYLSKNSTCPTSGMQQKYGNAFTCHEKQNEPMESPIIPYSSIIICHYVIQ